MKECVSVKRIKTSGQFHWTAATKYCLSNLRKISDCWSICPPIQRATSASHNPAMNINDVVKYSRPRDDEERTFRFRVLEIHRDVENPRAHIQLMCDWRIKPI